MARQTVTNRGRDYLVAWDEPQRRVAPPSAPLRPARRRGLAFGQAVDEITGRALSTLRGLQATLTATNPGDRRAVTMSGAAARATAEGIVGILGRDPLPAPVTLTVTAPGYIPMAVNIAPPPVLPPPSPPPGAIEFGDVSLRRPPVAFAGRVLRLLPGGGQVPLGGATVRITQYAPRFPAIGAGAMTGAAAIFGLSVPLGAVRALNSRVRRVDTVLIAAGNRTLAESAGIGDDRVTLSDADGVGPGFLLEIEADDAGRSEWASVASVPPGTVAGCATQITLTRPLCLPHGINVRVRCLQVTGNGAWNTFARTAVAGDAAVFLAAAVGLNDGDVTEIGNPGGAAPTEYRRIAVFATAADGNGEYRLPPIHRAALLIIEAADPGPVLPPPQTMTLALTIRPDYDLYENRLDFLLP